MTDTSNSTNADAAVRRLLRIPDIDQTTTQDKADIAAKEESAQRLFSFAMVISGLRCTLSYVILPFVLPALGLGATAGLGPSIGIPVGLIAIFFDVKGIRRFWVADYRYRWQMTIIYLAVIILVSILVIGDIVQLLH